MGEVIPVLISLPDGTSVNLVGEPVTDQLVISPALEGSRQFTGQFVVTHLPSGAMVGMRGMCVAHARALAVALARLPIDWSKSYDELHTDAIATTRANEVVRRIVDDCDLIPAFCEGVAPAARNATADDIDAPAAWPDRTHDGQRMRDTETADVVGEVL